MIYDHDHIFDKETGVDRKKYKVAPVVIGKNCWIGANAVILRGTTIGDNCVVGAGCVLKGNYSAFFCLNVAQTVSVHDVA